ncbi:hypothetical protein P0M11_05805 [Kaistella sp. PBT33-4]|uniref:hypothetical protein n=1 Tax=Kaistella sp. PBT33-4 TaxID=3032000 RepID=UPI0023D87FC9|nr:hypothetical protein [Kaistella sp. PBT33-4]MDF0719512.1 hypothetical protein [Kaistella sp. PBT33-4]
MTNKKEHWTNSAWTISIGTAIFSLLLTMGYDYSKEKPILTTVWTILKWVANLIWTVLNFDLKVWWIIVAVIVFILIIILIDKFKNEETFKPDFYSYREGKFKRWRWTWGWNWNSSKNAWIISGMKAHCPNCDTPMIEHSSIYGLSFDCPRCEFRASDGQCDEPHKIERIILDNIDRQRAEKKNSL